MPGSSGTRSYVENPFAAAPGAQSAAYANALRGYAPNAFAGSVGSRQTSMAPHLSQPVPLDADLISAYQSFRADPEAQRAGQSGVDINQLWRTSPTSPVFKPGYQHNPFVQQRADLTKSKREGFQQYQGGLEEGQAPLFNNQDDWYAAILAQNQPL